MSKSWSRSLKPDAIVALLLAAWWLVNLVQAALTGLADDEAYYWYFSQRLDWGYFDHPPMVALLVMLSRWLPGTLGIRFFSTLLQPLYLLLFWHLVKPSGATRHQAMVYVLFCFSMPLLQLYGFLAVPDAPLMAATVLFWWAFRRFSLNPRLPEATLMGAAAALLGYSKYHGLLVVLLAVVSNPRLLRRWQLYAAGAVALLLYAPHLVWQYNHDWASFGYHLAGRNQPFRINYPAEYILSLVLVFNPLWIVRYCRGIKTMFKSDDPLRRALAFTAVGFPAFFFVSTLRGPAQPQWLLPAVLPAVAILLDDFSFRRPKSTLPIAAVCAVLFVAVRVLAVANPMGLKGQIWDNRETYSQLAELADGRPIVFVANYTAPAKYALYTGGEAYSTTYYFQRPSQWQYDTADRTYTRRDVVVGNFTNHTRQSLALADGRTFYYYERHNWHPLREVTISTPAPGVPVVVSLPADSVVLTLDIHNPYPYDIQSAEGDTLRLQLAWYVGPNHWSSLRCNLVDTLPAGQTTRLKCTLRGTPPEPGTHRGNFSLGHRDFAPEPNSPTVKIEAMEVER